MSRLLLLAALFVWPLAVQAQDTGTPGPEAPATGLPDLDYAQSPEYRSAAYPSWRGDLLRSVGLEEHKRSEGGVLGQLSLTAGRDCWASVIYYAQTGRGLLLLDGLPLPAGQQTTLTFPLPPGDSGYTRLLLWDARPAAGALRLVEAKALDPQRRLAGVLDERWFSRSKPGPQLPPYSDFDMGVPAGIFRARLPNVRAGLLPDGTVVARNCAVYSRGPVRTGSDTWGSFGQWQLTSGMPLELKMVLPSRRDYSHVVLRLQGTAGSIAPREALRLSVEVNGWRGAEQTLSGGKGEAEQVSFDVSQNVEYGLNTFTLRMESFGAEWLLRRIELWIE
jgi:hypothetical protein